MVEADFPPPRYRPECTQHHRTANGRGFGRQSPGVDFEPLATRVAQLGISAVRLLVNPPRVLPDQSRGPCDSGTGWSTVGLVELWKDSMTHPVPWISKIGVGVILDPGLPPLAQIGPQVRPRHVDQRPDDRVATGVNRAQASQPRPSGQLQNKRLRLVIFGMADRDDICSRLTRGAPEEVVPDSPPGILEREPLAGCIAGHIEGFHDEGKAATGREVAAKRFILLGVRANLMIQVGNAGDPEATVTREFLKDQCQRNRIGSAGQPNEDAAPWGDQIVASNTPANLLQEG